MTRLRLFSLAEIVVLLVGSQLMVWFLAPRLGDADGSIPGYVLMVLMAVVYVSIYSPIWIHHDPPGLRGLGTHRTFFVRTDNLRADLRAYGLLAITGTFVLLALALACDTSSLHRFLERAFWIKLTLYLFSALGQQLFFMGFFFVRLRELFGAYPNDSEKHALRTRALVCGGTALLFAAYHIPNLPMMGFVSAFGFCLAWVFYARPNLLLAALCHAWLGTLLHRVVLLPMRVGPFYWQPDRYVYRTLFPFIRQWIGDLF